jgi:hypothetical protein
MSLYEFLKNNTSLAESVWFEGDFGFFFCEVYIKKHVFLTFKWVICNLKKLYL